MNNDIFFDLKQRLEGIFKVELKKLKESIEKNIVNDSTEGMSQMIGRRYGHLWETLVIETFKFHDKDNLKGKVFYKDYVNKWIKVNIDGSLNECCIKTSEKMVRKFVSENVATDKQDLCDFVVKKNKTKLAIDTKFRFKSNDSNTVREIANSAKHLKFMGYEPLLLFRKERKNSFKSPLNRFEKEGWNLKCGQEAIDFITTETRFNLGEWIEENIDIWAEIKEYQKKLKKLGFNEKKWEF